MLFLSLFFLVLFCTDEEDLLDPELLEPPALSLPAPPPAPPPATEEEVAPPPADDEDEDDPAALLTPFILAYAAQVSHIAPPSLARQVVPAPVGRRVWQVTHREFRGLAEAVVGGGGGGAWWCGAVGRGGRAEVAEAEGI